MEDVLRIELLGPLEIRGAAWRAWAKPGRKTQALLAYLAANPRIHARGELFDLFCGSAEDPAAALRWHLNRLRRWLGSSAIVADGDRLQINPQATWIDCQEFERVLGKNLEKQTVPGLSAAVDLFRGDFLAGASLSDASEVELWLAGERARFRRLYERGLNELIAQLIAQEQFESAIPRAVQLLQSNPILEQAHSRLIWLYAKVGQRQAALDQYECCRDLLRRELAVEPMPELTALQADVRAGRLGRSYAEPLPSEPVAPGVRQTAALVDRVAELETLRSLWHSAVEGRGSVVFLEAEAGGGKTRLAREFIQSLAGISPPVLRLSGQCYESTRTLPYHPWIELLETRLADLNDDALDRFSPFWMEQLTRLLPTLAGRRAKGTVSAPPTGGGELEHLFAAVVEFLFGEGEPASRIIFVDDLQWADESSLGLFHYLARRVAQRSTLLIGAFRPEELDDSPGLQTLLNDLRRDPLTELRLAPLDVDSVMALTAQLWPILPEGYRPHVCALLVKATCGNPLFVTEVLRELTGTADIPADVPVPPTVRALIERRLGKLPDSGRQVLQAIAILDSPATPDQAQRISVRSEEETVAALEIGWRWGLLKTAAEPHPSGYDFSHDLVRDAVLQQASDARRRMLHRRAAAVLAEAAGSIPAEFRPELAGRILNHATEGGLDPLILTWAPPAAEYARSLHVYADALRAYEAASRALDRMESTLEMDPSTANVRRLEMILARIEILGQLGRFEEQSGLLTQAAELLPRNPEPKLEAAFLLLRADHLARMNTYRPAFDCAKKAHKKYSRLGDTVHAAKSLVVCADAKQSLGDNIASFRLLKDALARYRDAGDWSGESICLSQIAGSFLDMGEVEKALEHLNRSLRLSEEHGDLFAQASASSWLGTAWIHYYNVEKIRFYAEATARLARMLENDFKASRAISYYMISEYIRENWSQSEALAQKAFDVAAGMKDGWQEGWNAHFLGRTRLMQGDLAGAERWLQHAYGVRKQHGEAQNLVSDLVWLGRLSSARGEPDRALAYASEAVQRMEKMRKQARVWEAHDVFMFQAEALTAAGQNGKAKGTVRRARSNLVRFADQIRDPKVRQEFFAAPVNLRIIAAWDSGRIRPFPYH